jgi:heat shock protein 1/8
MVEHCIKEFEKKYGVPLAGNKRALRRLRNSCEKAKRILSSST